MKKYCVLLVLGMLLLSTAGRTEAAPYDLTGDLSLAYADLIPSPGTYAEGITNTNAAFHTLTITTGVDIGNSSTPYAAAISGNVNLAVTARFVHLSVANSYAGTTSLTNGGGIVLRGSGTLGKGTITMSNGYLHSGNLSAGSITLANDLEIGSGGAYFYFGWSKKVQWTGNISDVNGQAGKLIIINDSGSTYLNPASGKSLTYSGGTDVNGTLILGGSNILPSAGKVTVNGTLDLNGFATTLTDNYVLNDGGSIKNSGSAVELSITNSADRTLSGSFSNVNLTKDGTGKLILSGSGASSATTLTVNAGSVELAKSGTGVAVTNLTVGAGTAAAPVTVKVTGTSASQIAGALTLADYDTFDLNGVSQTMADLKSAGTRGGADAFLATDSKLSTVTNTSATAATLTLAPGSYLNSAFDGKITGNLNLVITSTGGAGGYFYLNNSANDYSGTTTVSGGRLLITGSEQLGTGALILDGATLHNGNRAPTFTNDVQLGGNGGNIQAGWNKNITLAGAISDVAGQEGTLTIASDNGIVILAPAAGKTNTYSGKTIIKGCVKETQAGRLRMGAVNALPMSGIVVINYGVASTNGSVSYLDLYGYDTSIGLLAGDGQIQNTGSAPAKLTLGTGIAAGDSAEFTGAIVGASGKVITLEKVGAGDQTLRGNHSYTNLNVKDGTLYLAQTGTEVGAGDVSISGGTLQLEGDSSALITGTLAMTGGTLDLYGHDWTLSSSEAFPWTGGTIANSDSSQLSTLTIKQNNSQYQTSPISLSGNLKLVMNGSGNFGFTGTSPDFAGDVELKSAMTYVSKNTSLGTGTIHLQGGYLLNFSSSPTLSNEIVLESASTSGSGIRVGFGSDRTMTLNGKISGSGNLVLNSGEGSGGSITLNGSNTYLGTTEIYGTHPSVTPTYTVGSNTAFSTSTVKFHADANLKLNATDSDRTISNALKIDSGKTVTVSKSGSHEALLNGTYSGGSLIMESGTALQGSGSLTSLTFRDGSNLQVDLDFNPGVLSVGTLNFEGNADIILLANDYQTLKGTRFSFLNSDLTSEELAPLLDFSKVGGSKIWSYGLEGSTLWAQINDSAVPEPGTFALLFLSLAAIGGMRTFRCKPCVK